MLSDEMFPKYRFQKQYKVSVLDEEVWTIGPPIQAEIIIWYSDGSKIHEGYIIVPRQRQESH